jgi:predicted RNA-binding protein YlqC (UPF0109 family)
MTFRICCQEHNILIQNILLNLAKELLNDPNSLKCKIGNAANSTTLTLIPKSEKDVPRLIGKDGKTISAMRVIIRAIYASQGHTERLLITVKSVED